MQNQLFHETIFDALGADITACGGFKVVAGKLWPSENPTTSATKLRNAVNPEQAQKLCPEEVLQIKRLAKDVNSFATVNFEAQQLSYTFAWIEPQDELESLVRDLSGDMERINQRQARIEKLLSSMNRAQLRAVKP